MDNDNDVGDKDNDDIGDKGDDDDLTKHVEHPVILLDVVHAVQLVVDSSTGYYLSFFYSLRSIMSKNEISMVALVMLGNLSKTF